ncbi:hypothetical protein P3S68_001113 [Capsicum galapagoense]
MLIIQARVAISLDLAAKEIRKDSAGGICCGQKIFAIVFAAMDVAKTAGCVLSYEPKAKIALMAINRGCVKA